MPVSSLCTDFHIKSALCKEKDDIDHKDMNCQKRFAPRSLPHQTWCNFASAASDADKAALWSVKISLLSYLICS